MHTNSIPYSMARVGKKINSLNFQPHGDVNKIGFGNFWTLVTVA